jgi:hypothetical protein
MFVGGRVLFGAHRKVFIPTKMLKSRLLSKQGKLLMDFHDSSKRSLENSVHKEGGGERTRTHTFR